MGQAHLEQLFGLRGQVALVTGASSGLGVEFARGLAMAGADVALLARRFDRLQAVAKTCEDLGVRALPVHADLSDEEQIDAAIEQVTTQLGPIDILVNNAGVAPVGRAERHDQSKWRQALDINLTAVFLCTQKVGRQMIERGQGGRVIMISSVLGEGANAVHKTVGYAATKGAVTNMTRQLAVEWAPYDITVNALAPSWFPTEMITDPRVGRVNDAQRERMELLTPMGRLGREGELLGAIVFLASPSAS
jgi:NAD(P)-dependent dehydrogenase (short-subunit alcohol dehydrogenase family)